MVCFSYGEEHPIFFRYFILSHSAVINDYYVNEVKRSTIDRVVCTVKTLNSGSLSV